MSQEDMTVKELFENILKPGSYDRPPGVLYVTEIVSCPKVQYEVSEYSFALLAGTSIHHFIQKQFLEQGSNMHGFEGSWKIEVPVCWEISPYQLKGKIDFLNDEKKVLIELKTGEFYLSHLLQVRAYLNRYPDYTGYLVYLKKNNFGKISDNIRVMRVAKPLSIEELQKLVVNYVEKAGPPTSEFCFSCYYAGECRDRGRGGVLQTAWSL